MRKLLVTQHSGLKDFLIDKGILDKDVERVTHIFPYNEYMVEGAHVYGVLPLWLAAKADRVTEVKLRIPPELRSRELTKEQMEEFFDGIATYRIEAIDEE